MSCNRSKTYVLNLFSFFVALIMCSSCAIHSTEQGATSTEERLKTRVNQLMQAQIDDEWGVVYDILDSNFKKEVSKKKFIKQPREMEFGEYRIEKVDIDPDQKTATVRIKSNISVKGYQFTDTPSIGRWIFEDGDWHNVTDSFKSIFTSKPKPKP